MRNLNLYFTIIFLFPFFVGAQVHYTWTGAQSSQWDHSGNWSPSGIPGIHDAVTITLSGSGPVLHQSLSITNFNMVSGDLDLNGYTLTVTGDCNAAGGQVDNGILIQDGSITHSCTISGTFFGPGTEVDFTAGAMIFNGGVFDGPARFQCIGGGVSSGTGNVVFNGVTRLEMSGNGAISLGGNITTADSLFLINSGPGSIITETTSGSNYGGHVLLLTSAEGNIAMAQEGLTLFEGSIYCSSTGEAEQKLGSDNGQVQLGMASSLHIGAEGYHNSLLQLQNLTQTTPNVIDLTLEATATLSISESCIFSGRSNWSAGGITVSSSVFQQPCAITQTGNFIANSSGGNQFQDTLLVANYGTGTIAFATNMDDSMAQFLGFKSNQSGIIKMGSDNASIQLAMGTIVYTDALEFTQGTLELNQIVQTDATPVSLAIGSSAKLQMDSCYLIGDLNITGGNISLWNNTVEGALNMTKNGALQDENGGNVFNLSSGNSTITNNGSGNLFFGSNDLPDAFHGVTHVYNNQTANIYLAHSGFGSIFHDSLYLENAPIQDTAAIYISYGGNLTQLEGPVVVTNSNGKGIFFSPLENTSTILATGQAIHAGTLGFEEGTLQLGHLTQADATPLSFTLGTNASLVLGPSSDFGGILDATAGGIELHASMYRSQSSFVKTGSSVDTSIGGNFFMGALSFTLEGEGTAYLGTGNNGDFFSGVTEFQHHGNGNLYMAHGSADNQFLDSVRVLVSGSTAASCGVRIGEIAGSEMVFSGPVNFQTEGSNNLIRLANASSTEVQFESPLTLNKWGTSGASNTMIIGGSGTIGFQEDVFVSSNTSGNLAFNFSTGSSEMAIGKKIIIGAVGFTDGTLYIARHTQLGSAHQELNLGSNATLRIGPASDFGGSLNGGAGNLYINQSIFRGEVQLTKNGTVNSLNNGGNQFMASATINHQSDGLLAFGNGYADHWESDLNINNTGRGSIHLAYLSSGNLVEGKAYLYNSGHTLSNVGIHLCNGADASIQFLDSVYLKNLGTHNSLTIRINNGTNSVTDFGGPVIAHNGGISGASNTVNFGIRGTVYFRDQVRLTSVSSGAINVGSASSIVHQSSGKNIQTDSILSGNIIFNNFRQALPVTGMMNVINTSRSTNSLISVISSVFTGNLNMTGPLINDLRNNTFHGAVVLTKLASTANNLLYGGNTFYGATTISNESSYSLGMANTSGDTYYGNIVFSKTGTGSLFPNYRAACDYYGNINVQSNSIITFGNANGVTQFKGGNVQVLSKSPGSPLPNFKWVVMNKTANYLELNCQMNVTNVLTLTNGIIRSSIAFPLRMSNNALCNLGNENSFVDGPFQQLMAVADYRTLNFPVGKGDDWRPVTLEVGHTSSNSFLYTTELINGSAVELGYTLPEGVDSASNQRYWDIERTYANGTPAPDDDLDADPVVTLYFGRNDYIYDGNSIVVLKNTYDDPGTWINIGGTNGPAGPSPTPLDGSITSTSAPSPFTSFSRFTLGYMPSIFLGASLTDFKVLKEAQNGILYWTTEDENQLSHFEIEKSTDGFLYYPIGIVLSAGGGNSSTHYQFVDNHLLKGTNYYRLKMMDYNGQFTYSLIRAIEVETSDFLQLYPNPASTSTVLSIYGQIGKTINIHVVDGLGRVVLDKKSELNSNQHQELIQTGMWEPGFYQVFLNDGQRQYGLPLVITGI